MKTLTVILITTFLVMFSFAADRISVKTLIDTISTTATSSTFETSGAKKTFQFVGATATGTGAATALVQISNDNTNWITTDTLSLTLSASASSDSYYLDAPWKYMRGIVNSITGTGATVSLHAGEESRF